MAEILFETLLGALETTRGTAIAAPTHYLTIEEKTMINETTYHQPPTSTGTFAEFTATTKAYEESVLEVSGSLDLKQLTWWLSLALGNPVTTTPAGGVLARLHTFNRTMATDVARSASFWWGDPNTQMYRAAYHMLENITIGFAADSDDGITFSATTRGRSQEAVVDPVEPAQVVPAYAYGIEAQLYIDSGATAIGTTAITGRLVRGEVRMDFTRSRKRHAIGPVSTVNPRTFDTTGVGRSHAEMDLEFEFYDTTQYALIRDATDLKTRLRLTGPVADPTGTPVRNYYVEFDFYGPMINPTWGEYMDTNRTLMGTIVSSYNSDARTAGFDYAAKVQTASPTV